MLEQQQHQQQNSKQEKCSTDTKSVINRGPNSYRPLTQNKRSSPKVAEQLKRKENNATHTQQHGNSSIGSSRSNVTAACGSSRDQRGRRLGLRSARTRVVHGDGFRHGDDGVVVRLAATGASSRRQRRQVPARTRRRTAVDDQAAATATLRVVLPDRMRRQHGVH